jgi:DNA invertase Pin-like site-specific DNA recombinase
MRRAYSYVRISSAEQRKGDGEIRQKELVAAHCRKHGLELDDTLKL